MHVSHIVLTIIDKAKHVVLSNHVSNCSYEEIHSCFLKKEQSCPLLDSRRLPLFF